MGAYLTDPEVAKVTTMAVRDTFEYAASAMQGWRDTMEDYCVVSVDSEVVCLGVLDGHGGKEVAAFAAGYLARTIPQKILTTDSELALRTSFLEVDDQLRTVEVQSQLARSLNDGTEGAVIVSDQGCAALVALLTDSHLVVANAGDCRCVLGVNGEAVQVTTDHKPLLPSERQRILSAGSSVIDGRVNDILDLSRGLGDLAFKANGALPPESQAITAVPETYTVPVTADTDFVVMATDGVWDVLTSEACVDLIYREMRGRTVGEVAEKVLENCLAADPNNLGGLGCDNMACVLIRFLKPT